MKTLILLLTLTIAGLFWMNSESKALTHRLENAQKIISEQKNSLDTAAHQLATLRENTARNERAQAALRQQRDRAQQLVNRDDLKMKRLLNENADLRRWFQSPLPDDIARLHTRPAFDTPTDYLQWLSESSQLPHSTESAQNER
ncbi:hypothetical protein A6V27_19540 [Hafnia alvei]|nr:hypothetical protein A6V27_19540 [Hafnia alvei]